MRTTRLASGCIMFALLGAASASPQTQSAGAPVTTARATQFDVTSRLNGEPYRVLVSTPFGVDSSQRVPAVYLLDGNMYFAMASARAAGSGAAVVTCSSA